jgi:hypothetical protein
MSLLTINQAQAGATRPLLGLGIIAAALLAATRIATKLLQKEKQPVSGSAEPTVQSQSYAEDALKLARMARELEASQPNVASELRALAAYGL